MTKLQRLELLKDFVEEAIDRGARSLEEITQYVSDLPFEALERTGLIDANVGGLHDKKVRTVGMVYDAICNINRQIGELLSDQFQNVEDMGLAARTLKENARRRAARTPQRRTVRKARKSRR